MLPTGSGKSLCFVALPLVFEKLRGDQGLSSIIVVISPLMKAKNTMARESSVPSSDKRVKACA